VVHHHVLRELDLLQTVHEALTKLLRWRRKVASTAQDKNKVVSEEHKMFLLPGAGETYQKHTPKIPAVWKHIHNWQAFVLEHSMNAHVYISGTKL